MDHSHIRNGLLRQVEWQEREAGVVPLEGASKVCVVITVGKRWKWQHIGGAGEEGEPGSLQTPSNWTGHCKWRESVINLIRQA